MYQWKSIKNLNKISNKITVKSQNLTYIDYLPLLILHIKQINLTATQTREELQKVLCQMHVNWHNCQNSLHKQSIPSITTSALCRIIIGISLFEAGWIFPQIVHLPHEMLTTQHGKLFSSKYFMTYWLTNWKKNLFNIRCRISNSKSDCSMQNWRFINICKQHRQVKQQMTQKMSFSSKLGSSRRLKFSSRSSLCDKCLKERKTIKV